MFLLESVEGGERVGRYTFIGIRPYKQDRRPGNSRSTSRSTGLSEQRRNHSKATSSPCSKRR